MSATEPAAQNPVIWIAVHDLSRTGVPVLLARLLQASPMQQRRVVHVVAIFGGPLLSELQSLCASVTVLEPSDRRSASSAASLGLITLGMDRAGELVRHSAWRAKLARRPKPDVLVVHGAGAWPVAQIVSSSLPVLLHLHELETALDRSIPRPEQAAAFQRAQQVMVVSAAVAELARSRGAKAEKILMVPGCVRLPETDAPETDTPYLDTPSIDTPSIDRGPWVFGAGTPGWRKGTDRLAAVAHELQRLNNPARVGWIGGRPSGADATAVGRTDLVTWIPELADPWKLLSRAAVFVLPSREDPLPLVALEAGMYRRAVVAMPTGGLPDLLADGRGLVGSSQDIRWFVGAVQQVLASKELAEDLGQRLHEFVRTHHDVDVIAPLWLQAVTQTAGR
jgi:glycosyltransferase involved in cell wall biosynthesis